MFIGLEAWGFLLILERIFARLKLEFISPQLFDVGASKEFGDDGVISRDDISDRDIDAIPVFSLVGCLLDFLLCLL